MPTRNRSFEEASGLVEGRADVAENTVADLTTATTTGGTSSTAYGNDERIFMSSKLATSQADFAVGANNQLSLHAVAEVAIREWTQDETRSSDVAFETLVVSSVAP